MRLTWLSTGILITAAFLGACSDNVGSTGATSGGSDAGSTCGLTPVTNGEFCEANAVTPDCSQVTSVYKTSACGVPLKTPPGELKRSENVEEYAGSGPPQVECFLPGGYPAAPGTSKLVTVKGIAKIFSHGCNSKALSIEIHEVKRTGGDDDGELGAVVGSPITTAADCSAAGAGLATPDDDCSGTRYECNYEYANVPTEKELVITTDGAADWAPLYDYNVYIANSEVQNDVWAHDVRALAQDDYGAIAQVALGGPVTATHGVLAGEVHDCGNVRLENAVVDVDAGKRITTYFTDDEEHPLPDLSKKGTSTLALYAAMDIKEGPVTVAAAGLVNGEVISIGHFRARIYPDAVTAVTFRGLRPFQVP